MLVIHTRTYVLPTYKVWQERYLMKKTKEEAEATRQAILQSALDTFCEKGYSKTTFDEIAKRINLTKGAVYWHFRNKPDVIAALINAYCERQKKYIHDRVHNTGGFSGLLKLFLCDADFILSDENNRKMVFFMTCQMEWSEAIITKVLPQVAKNKEYWFNQVKEILTFLQKSEEIGAGVNIELLTHMLMNLWFGTLDAYLSKRCEIDLKTIVTESFNLIFNGLKKEGIENASK